LFLPSISSVFICDLIARSLVMQSGFVQNSYRVLRKELQ
jgi:hypothetical protein